MSNGKANSEKPTQAVKQAPAQAAQAAQNLPKQLKSQAQQAAPKQKPQQPEKPSIPKGEDPREILDYTPLDEIPAIVSKLSTNFFSKGKLHSLQNRLNQLRNLYFAIKDNTDALAEALYKDFRRSQTETRNMEIIPFLNELLHTMANLHQWAKPDAVEGLPVIMKTNPIYVEKIPLGTVLIIAPFNYPLLLSLSSLVAAISAGNNTVLKVSELTPHFAQLLTQLLTQALDNDVFAMVNGAIPETQALLDQKFDKIMYTGSTAVGTIIAKKAAETLTPVLLELGGKSPAFVLDDVTDSDIETVARRIVWGRYSNAGQTCVAVDYVLVHESVKAKLVKSIVKVINEDFYPGLDSKDPTYTHLIHLRAFENLSRMIQNTKGDIVAGGTTDAATRYIAPTVVDNVDWEDSTMQQEIFGPILPVVTYSDLKEAVGHVIHRHDTPLSLYVFTSKSTSRAKNPQVDYIRTNVRSGGTIVNDAVMHVALAGAPFGGIGQSGIGSYHGYYSFRAFSHERTTMEQPLALDFALKVRYPPYTEKKDKLMEAAMLPHNNAVWFGKSGDVNVNGPNLLWSAWHGATGLGSIVYNFVKNL